MTANEYKIIWHRLKIMTPGEVWYRFSRNIKARAQKSRKNGSRRQWRDFLRDPDLASLDGAIHLLEDMQGRSVFPWQKLSTDEISRLFRDQWPNVRTAAIHAADDLCAHRFRIFNRQLSFNGRIDWHYDVLTDKRIPLKHWTDLPYWQSDLAPGVKYIWELNRLQHFVVLAKAFLLTSEEKYVEELHAQWQDWLEQNPSPFGINWTSPLESALRIISFTWGLQMCKNSHYITAEFYMHILQSISEHAEHVAGNLSYFSSANNHLLGEALGLIYAGCYYPELKAAGKWRELGFSIFFDQIAKQVFADGVLKEQTTYYQRYVFDFCLLAMIAADYCDEKMPGELLKRMEKMAEFVRALMMEPADVPEIGDADGGETLHLSENNANPYGVLLAEAALLFNRGDFKAKAAPWCEQLFWLFGEEVQERYEAIIPENNTSLVEKFDKGGYIILRTRAGALPQRAVFDVGPLGLDAMSSHGHADALSLILSVNGVPALIDSGTYTYRGNRKWRDYFRSTRAHNTLVIDGISQSEMVGPFQWGRRAQTRLLSCSVTPQRSRLVAQHDGYRHKGVMHTRQILFNHVDRWTVEDIIEGNGRHTIEVLWHLTPCRYDLTQDGRAVFYFPQFSLTFTSHSQKTLHHEIISSETKPIQGWFSPEFAVKKKNPVLTISTTAMLPVHIFTEIVVEEGDHLI
ncbi:alginate lyase family protein [candidate division KSB1 bacterium]|nr:alginate lyase family protein [candidate division KSB1 bacterium]